MPILYKKHHQIEPARLMILGFTAIILVGATLLAMPFSSSNGEFTNFIDSLFTATSATCVTGITIFDTYAHWSYFGQGVIIMLIQVGGLGFLTLVTFINLALGKKLGWKTVKTVASDYTDNILVSTKRLFSEIVIYSFAIELLGAIILMFVFVPEFGLMGIWQSIFIAISAFCNAGFDLLTVNPGAIGISEFTGNPVVIFTLASLIILGGLGFMVWENFRHYKRINGLLLHTKVVLITTAILLLAGTAIIFVSEFNNPDTMANMPVGEKLMTSFFMSTSSRTAGFPAFDLSSMSDLSKMGTAVLMFIGAAPASTGGGIKVTTLAIILATAYSVIKNREETEIMGSRIKKGIVYKTLTVFVLSLTVVLISFCLVFFLNEDISISQSFFEIISAFSTTGFSLGVSADVNDISKVIIALTMLAGRVGPVTFMVSIMAKRADRGKDIVMPEGNILVG